MATFNETQVQKKREFSKKQIEIANQCNTADSYNPTIKYSDLTEGTCYDIDELKHVKTQFGQKVVAVINFQDPDTDEYMLCDLFLPDRYKKLEAGKLHDVKLKYDGIEKEGKYPKHLITFVDATAK